jgi:hypothetical protein
MKLKDVILLESTNVDIGVKVYVKSEDVEDGKFKNKYPAQISGDFLCYSNKLTSLEGAPSSVGGHFWCHENKLTSLEGAPSSVGGHFWCYDNKLASLKNIHKYISFVGNTANFSQNPIKSHVLGLLKIKGLKSVKLDNEVAQQIINRELAGSRSILSAIRDLTEAGFGEFAQL